MTADEQALVEAEAAFNRAMISNDAAKIRQCISADWVLVTPERGPIAGAAVLDAIASGTLVHDAMTKQSRLFAPSATRVSSRAVVRNGLVPRPPDTRG